VSIYLGYKDGKSVWFLEIMEDSDEMAGKGTELRCVPGGVYCPAARTR
jgi:hypothetical protein